LLFSTIPIQGKRRLADLVSSMQGNATVELDMAFLPVR